MWSANSCFLDAALECLHALAMHQGLTLAKLQELCAAETARGVQLEGGYLDLLHRRSFRTKVMVVCVLIVVDPHQRPFRSELMVVQ